MTSYVAYSLTKIASSKDSDNQVTSSLNEYNLTCKQAKHAAFMNEETCLPNKLEYPCTLTVRLTDIQLF